MDCCQDRLDGFRVYIDDLLVGNITVKEGQQKYTFNVDRVGSVVTVNKTGAGVLSMSEVVVMGVEHGTGKIGLSTIFFLNNYDAN